jgi:hypothetical protein
MKAIGKYTPLAYNEGRMVIVETQIFTKLIKELMSDEDYRALQEALVNRPDAGDLIRGSGGLRKISVEPGRHRKKWWCKGHLLLGS